MQRKQEHAEKKDAERCPELFGKGRTTAPTTQSTKSNTRAKLKVGYIVKTLSSLPSMLRRQHLLLLQSIPLNCIQQLLTNIMQLSEYAINKDSL